MAAWLWTPSRVPGELYSGGRGGGDPAIAIPLFGDCWLMKKGSDFVHSLVYCVAVDFVVPRADKSGDVVALYVCGA